MFNLYEPHFIHKAESRGGADYGWLNAKHSFSFSGYYNPERIHFGVLRVLNDDIIAPNKGFDEHPHENMEIITIPLSGKLVHIDSMGNKGVLESGEIQVMSAGSGIRHSEYNGSETEHLKLLQIWLFPNANDLAPRYDQMRFDKANFDNQFFSVVSNEKRDDSLFIHQNARILLGNFDANQTIEYKKTETESAFYLFLIEGEIKVNDAVLQKRDAAGWQVLAEKLSIDILQDAKILLFELPMHVHN